MRRTQTDRQTLINVTKTNNMMCLNSDEKMNLIWISSIKYRSMNSTNVLSVISCPKSALWFLMAACWTGSPPPTDHSASTDNTLPAPRADAPAGFLSAPALSTGWAYWCLTVTTVGSFSPNKEIGAFYSRTVLGATSQSGGGGRGRWNL